MKQAVCAALMALVAAPALAGEFECREVNAEVRLVPDPACSVADQVPGAAYLRAPGTCFLSVLSGSHRGSGASGLTAELASSLITGGASPLPAMLAEGGVAAAVNEHGLPETRRVFSARSVMRLRDGTLYTADAGVLHAGRVAEQLLVTGGTGRYAGATGTLYASGALFAGGALLTGEICSR